MTSFATELATPSVTDERTLRTLHTNTLPGLIYSDDVWQKQVFASRKPKLLKTVIHMTVS